jgi:hypothetical protein
MEDKRGQIKSVGLPLKGKGGQFYPAQLDTGETVLGPRFTSVADLLDKPGLMYWAAQCERGFKSWGEGAPAGWWKIARDLAINPAIPRDKADAAVEVKLRQTMGTYKNGNVKYGFASEQAKALGIGSSLHDWAEWYFKKELGEPVGEEPPLCGQAETSAANLLEWRDKVKLVPLGVEVRGFCLCHRVGGMVDLPCLVDGVPTILDWKTSKAVYETHKMQVAFYLHMINAMPLDTLPGRLRAWLYAGHGPGKMTRGLVVRLPKDDEDVFNPDKCVVWVDPDEADYMKAFEGLLAVYHWQRQMKGYE